MSPNIYPILEFLIAVILAGISWFLVDLNRRININTKEISEVQVNYLERFSEINNKLSEIHTDIAVIKNNCQNKNDKCE